MAKVFIDWSYATNAFFEWVGQLVEDPLHVVVMVICFVAVQWAIQYILYKQKLILKV